MKLWDRVFKTQLWHDTVRRNIHRQFALWPIWTKAFSKPSCKPKRSVNILPCSTRSHDWGFGFLRVVKFLYMFSVAIVVSFRVCGVLQLPPSSPRCLVSVLFTQNPGFHWRKVTTSLHNLVSGAETGRGFFTLPYFRTLVSRKTAALCCAYWLGWMDS